MGRISPLAGYYRPTIYKLIIYNTVTPTTIQVQDDVYRMLNALKKELKAESYKRCDQASTQ